MLRRLALSFTCRSLVMTTVPCSTGCGNISSVMQDTGKGSNAAFDLSCEGTGREVMWIQGTQNLLIYVFSGAEMWKKVGEAWGVIHYWSNTICTWGGWLVAIKEQSVWEDVESVVRHAGSNFLVLREMRFFNLSWWYLSLESYCIQLKLCHLSLELSFIS